MKILPVEAKFSMRTDGQTNRQTTKLIVAFSNFANAPKKNRGVAGSCALVPEFERVFIRVCTEG